MINLEFPVVYEAQQYLNCFDYLGLNLIMFTLLNWAILIISSNPPPSSTSDHNSIRSKSLWFNWKLVSLLNSSQLSVEHKMGAILHLMRRYETKQDKTLLASWRRLSFNIKYNTPLPQNNSSLVIIMFSGQLPTNKLIISFYFKQNDDINPPHHQPHSVKSINKLACNRRERWNIIS